MVINNYKGGQLANRLFLFAHFIANSIEYKYRLINPEFDEYEPYFEAPSKNNFENYPISVTLFKNHFADRAFSRLFRLWADITHKLFTGTPLYKLYRIFNSHDKKMVVFDLNNPVFVKDALTKKIITEGWLFRDAENLLKHEDTIRRFLKPVEKYRLEVDKVIKEARMAADTIIGVHIRRGDYIRFNDGKWFYDDSVYAEKMMQVKIQMAAIGKTCAFFICSNEPVNPANFPSELKLFTGPRHFIVDLYGMAACDAILGPPSTFSSWASFFGKVPIKHIRTKDDVIEFNEYLIIV